MKLKARGVPRVAGREAWLEGALRRGCGRARGARRLLGTGSWLGTRGLFGVAGVWDCTPGFVSANAFSFPLGFLSQRTREFFQSCCFLKEY